MKNLLRTSSLLVLLLALLSQSSCKKDDISRAELLQQNVWNWDKASTNSTDPDVQTLIAFLDALMTGATLEFFDDGTYTISSGTSTETGQWSLSDNEEKLIMDMDEMDIVKLTETELVMEGEETSNEYGTYSVILYWVN